MKISRNLEYHHLHEVGYIDDEKMRRKNLSNRMKMMRRTSNLRQKRNLLRIQMNQKKSKKLSLKRVLP